jgi:hypothetical protein
MDRVMEKCTWSDGLFFLGLASGLPNTAAVIIFSSFSMRLLNLDVFP